MEHGFEATSLRQITALAEVNLAAVSYHFGSKEELFESVLTRRLDPMNRERIALLTRFEREAAPDVLSCERILTAMFIPALELARDRRARRAEFPPLARSRLRRSGAIHPAISVRAVRGDDRSLQGGVRACAAGASEKGAVLAPALRHGRPVVHARRHRRAETDRGAQSARGGQRRNAAASSGAVPGRGARRRRCPTCPSSTAAVSRCGRREVDDVDPSVAGRGRRSALLRWPTSTPPAGCGFWASARH